MNIRVVLLIPATALPFTEAPPEEKILAECLRVTEVPEKSDTMTFENQSNTFVVIHREWHYRERDEGPAVVVSNTLGSMSSGPWIGATLTVIKR